MKKVVLTYGAISGLVVTTMMLGMVPLWQEDGQMDMDKGEILGYISMIVSLSMIFFGVKNYRDKHQEGVITFGKAFKVGFLIALVASSIYVAGWMFYYGISEAAQDFPQKYVDYQIEQMVQNGASEVEIEEKRVENQQFLEMYKNPFIRIGMTLMEILPVGLLVSLLTALILKRKTA
ncbi:MAG: DUF4199 domain-containing protein [Saprospiraceae bacterium]|nr:DUF4199 domain-containing protein [Saprospiraceae bacterium]